MWLSGGTYLSWAQFLDRWSGGDDSGFDTLPSVSAQELNAETLARLAGRIVTAMSTRLQDWADRLTRAIGAESGEFEVGRALAQARGGLSPIRRLAAHPSLPAELRTQLQQLVDRQITSTQEQMESDLDRMAAAGVSSRQIEARRRTIRHNPLTVVLAQDAAARPDFPALPDPAAPSRRRIIIN